MGICYRYGAVVRELRTEKTSGQTDVAQTSGHARFKCRNRSADILGREFRSRNGCRRRRCSAHWCSLVLIGDSLGNVLQGHLTTIPVKLKNIVYHTKCVARGNTACLVIADMPFGNLGSKEQAYKAAAKLMQAGAHAVKIEGGEKLEDIIRFLIDRAIPFCDPIGLAPQAVHMLGDFRIQVRSDASADQLVKDAFAFQRAGAQMLVMEAVPATLAEKITGELHIPTIGISIGAGAACSGQVLVIHDLLGISVGKRPRFVREFLVAGVTIQGGRYRRVCESGERREFSG